MPSIIAEGETTQGPYESDPEFIGIADFGSGAKMAGATIGLHAPACLTTIVQVGQRVLGHDGT